ncbi:MAG: hypothetical protein Q9P90_05420 [candidate division KSB1 bacterium]|nr:hypothetical protein [candidate division KSB1 bacterium]
MENLYNNFACLLKINISDTLRYFYSAIFQGFAAVIGIGGMFYVFYKQNLSNKKEKILNAMESYYSTEDWGNKALIQLEGVQNRVKRDLERYKPRIKELAKGEASPIPNSTDYRLLIL